MCDEVTCPPAPVCRLPGVCYRGNCSFPAEDDLTPCDDGNPLTDDDQCIDASCQGINYCDGVVCEPLSQCHTASTCAHGVCSLSLPKKNGTDCDDGDLATDRDQCLGGVCRGEYLCQTLGVTCAQPALGSCYDFVECANGRCPPFALKAVNSSCDDQDEATVDDRCTATGDCLGIDLCKVNNITCATELGQCQTALSCFQGLCPTLNKKNGLDCDDDNPATDRDQCRDGVCRGVLLCQTLNITCPQPKTDSCHEFVECANGRCPAFTFKAINSSCDDRNATTDFDRCTATGDCVGIDLCEGVTCLALSQCHVPGVCSHGECSESLARPVGFECDDDNEATDFDTCNGKGECAGIDLCVANNVSCAPPNQCQEPVVCSHGSCPPHPVRQGIACSDGLVRTQNDTCNAQGQCVGIDLCVVNQVDCSAALPCQLNRGCLHGICLYQAEDDDSPCDDGLEHTLDDACYDGKCLGVDYCDDVVCSPSQCRQSPTCLHGLCSPGLPLQNDIECDDEDPRTDLDRCVGGACVGIDLCIANNITCPPLSQCFMEGHCSNGVCTPVLKPNRTRCDDGNPNTVNGLFFKFVLFALSVLTRTSTQFLCICFVLSS